MSMKLQERLVVNSPFRDWFMPGELTAFRRLADLPPGAIVLDMSGLAQKGGPVMSHVRLADNQADLHSTRVGTGSADLVIGCDLIVTASRDALSRMGEGRTYAAINSTGSSTAAFVKNPDWQFPAES